MGSACIANWNEPRQEHVAWNQIWKKEKNKIEIQNSKRIEAIEKTKP